MVTSIVPPQGSKPLGKRFTRAIYLAANCRINIPNIIARNVEQGVTIQEVAQRGILGTATEMGVDPQQLWELYQRGEKLGPATEDELRTILTLMAQENLESEKESYALSEYMKAYGEVNDFLTGKGTSIIAKEEVSLGTNFQGSDIPKWNTGFQPLDLLLKDGLYQAILTIIGKTGQGKTSIMLALMAYMRIEGIIDEAWFYETEIPMQLMLYKLKHLRDSGRVEFDPRDMMLTGLTSTQEIMKSIQSNPNKRRAIFIDSPDVMAGDAGEGKRFAIEHIYRDLVAIKDMSQVVIVASQGRRNDKQMTAESVAESYAKAQYSDILIGIQKGPPTSQEGQVWNNVQMNVAKNRFGASDIGITFPFNYSTLEYLITDKMVEDFQADEDW